MKKQKESAIFTREVIYNSNLHCHTLQEFVKVGKDFGKRIYFERKQTKTTRCSNLCGVVRIVQYCRPATSLQLELCRRTCLCRVQAARKTGGDASVIYMRQMRVETLITWKNTNSNVFQSIKQRSRGVYDLIARTSTSASYTIKPSIISKIHRDVTLLCYRNFIMYLLFFILCTVLI